ncbi:MAG TPA: hypothetical protein VF173_30880 [Thermoanaerobaculia bacterium]|nr:hypothetical protein [Thermoanaerobaculia bacterium]
MRNSTVKLASLGICCFLLWMTGAGAASGKQKVKHAAGPVAKHGHHLQLKAATQGYCESDCCWATGEQVYCDNGGCWGSDSQGTAIYICNLAS